MRLAGLLLGILLVALTTSCATQEPYTEDDCVIDSVEFDGMTFDEAREACKPPEGYDDAPDGY